MVDSGFGRTDLAQVGQRWTEPWRPAEADDGRMRKPGALLAFVHAECLEAPMQVAGERGRMPPSSSKTSIPTLRVSR